MPIVGVVVVKRDFLYKVRGINECVGARFHCTCGQWKAIRLPTANGFQKLIEPVHALANKFPEGAQSVDIPLVVVCRGSAESQREDFHWGIHSADVRLLLLGGRDMGRRRLRLCRCQ